MNANFDIADREATGLLEAAFIISRKPA
jgi:hypothetical protein